MLHGRGADEHDLYEFLDLLDPGRRLVGVTPGAPLSLPPGGRHWYVVPRVGYPEPETFHASYDLLRRELPALTGVPWERTILGGFSQGTVMAYALGLGSGQPEPAGIIAMSGFIPTVDGCLAEVVAAVPDGGGALVITADHGNADNMLEPDGSPNTAHSLNPVPLIVTVEGVKLRDGGILADVAPTVLDLLGIEQPAAMTGRSLLV